MSLEPPSFQTLKAPAPSAQAIRWRKILSTVIYGLAASGAAWLAARYYFVAETDFGQQLPAWAPKALAIHGAFAMAFLIALGSWLPVHVVPRVQQQVHRNSGWSQLGLLVILVVTGFGLYYVAGEESRPAWSAVHWLAGVVFMVIYFVHRRAVR